MFNLIKNNKCSDLFKMCMNNVNKEEVVLFQNNNNMSNPLGIMKFKDLYSILCF